MSDLRPLRIAQVAPLFEAVPPLKYGGTERVVHWLTEALVAMGHDVTLFATAESRTSAKLAPMRARAERFARNFEYNNAPYAAMIERIARRADDFDIVHFHIDFHPFSVFTRQAVPFLTTLHGRMDQAWIPDIYGLFPTAPLVSISQSHRAPQPQLNWAGTVLHGMPADILAPRGAGGGGYFAFLGRISPEKGIEDAIRIAAAAGLKLKVAAKIGEEDLPYYQQVVAPLLGTDAVEYVGEIDDSQKPEFLSNAAALLFPIDWPEPFGLVMIEAMACGCPVIARRRGSVPEVIEDGLTGFITDDLAQDIAAVGRLPTLNRGAIRGRFEQRWTSARMADDYVSIYRRLIAANSP